MTRTTGLLSLMALALVPALGCGLEEITDGGTADAIPADVQAALDETCATAGCHANGGALVNLGPGASAAILDTMASTGDPFVTIGDVEASYLARKMLGTDISGSKMPLSTQSPNDAVNVAIILGWIAGAEFSDGGDSGDTTDDTTDDTGDTTDTGMDPTCYADLPVPALPSFETDVWPTLEARCTAGCHMNMGLVPHMPDAMGAFDNLVGVMSSTGMNYVSADSPDDSYMWHKLSATHMQVGGTGGPMPQVGAMCTIEMQTIYAWILAGALP